MVALKIELEQYFVDNWTETPIQFQGNDYTAPIDNRWIYIEFIPIDRAIYSMGCPFPYSMDTVMLRVYARDTTPTASLSLDDEVRTFIECFQMSSVTATVGDGVPDGLGIVDLGNSIFETASNYTIEAYN